METLLFEILIFRNTRLSLDLECNKMQLHVKNWPSYLALPGRAPSTKDWFFSDETHMATI